MADERQRRRASTYRPRTPTQKARRQELWETRAEDRKSRDRISHEAALKIRLRELEVGLLNQGRTEVQSDKSTTPLDQIEDDVRRFHVLKARVERLEALWSINQRKRETRGKIIIGGAVLAEAGQGLMLGDSALLAQLVDILDRRVERVRDRLTVRELLGNVPLSLRPGGDKTESLDDALRIAGEVLPNFDAMAETAMAEDLEAESFEKSASDDAEIVPH